MESLIVTTAIIGLVEFIKALNGRDYVTAEIIFGAALIGGYIGYTGIDHLTIATGIESGLAAAGMYKGAQLVAGQ